MKYIDAEELKERITEQIKSLPREVGRGAGTLTSKGYGMMEAFQIMRSIIDSLQQEQPEQKKNCAGCPHCVDRKDQYGWHFKGCFGGPYNGKFIAEIDECPLKQEQPEVDLEKEIDELWESLNTGHDYVIVDSYQDFLGICLHCFELGLNVRKEDK